MLVLLVAALFGVNAWVLHRSSAGIVASTDHLNKAWTIVVLGSFVTDDGVSACVEERLQRAFEVYSSAKGQRFLITGDHGRNDYDEVNTMLRRLVQMGVPKEHIFLDHAGFDTYDSMWRAKHVFQVDSAIIVSQGFHLPRAQYLASAVGLRAQSIAADPPDGSVCARAGVREPLARIKAFMNAVLRSEAHHAGPAIPITGSSSASHDQ
ncbi:MAG: YdcF family protein [Flavobacteriales bacterium]|nr:MAG: YdcF family protein [Flavobacteriales bacterium]